MKTPNRCVSATSSRLAASTLAILTSAAAQAQPIAQWDLPGQPLADSLREVAARTDSNILFDGKLVSGQSARPLNTEASADQALAHLLAGTGLTYRHLDERTVTIQLASAQDNGPTSITRSPQGITTGLSKEAMEIEEIVVTGTQIRGIENKTAPVIVLSRSYMDSTGFGTTTKLIESLPQNFALANQSGIFTNGVSDSGEQGAGVNLRGIGEGTTLVLLNGRRLAPGFRSAAVDISALPLTAFEQVEILTDGASAIYGSDAVGGVVNFILRDDFAGAETRLRTGFADGTNEYRASQALGNSWGTGNALLSVEYYKRDLLKATDRDFVPSNASVGSLLPEDENYSGVFTGKQQLSDSVSAFADLLYTRRDTFNQGGRVVFAESNAAENSQALGTLGVDWAVGGDWQIELAGSYGENELDLTLRNSLSGTPVTLASTTQFASESAQLKADGTVLTLPGGPLRMAIGGDWRSESYETAPRGTTIAASLDLDQIVRSAFTEFYIPLVGESNAVTGVRSLELSIAGRYDDYSTFGSSFDPQYGLMWEPVAGFRLRGRHGTSYKAPNLIDFNPATTAVGVFPNLDPGDPTGFTYQLQVAGTDTASLRAQESESSSFGLEFEPASVDGLSLSLNYYRIKYRNRITNPPLDQVLLANPAAFGSLVNRNPTVDQINQLVALANMGGGLFVIDPITFMPTATLDPTAVQVIVDTRRRNLSVVDTSGVDLSTQYDFKLGESRLALGLDATYVLEINQQVTSASTPVDTVDTYFNPPDWRARAYVSWQRAGWATNLFVNHTDSYTDNRVLGAPVPISSYTTVDARLAYDFSNRFSGGFLSGVTVAANVQNVADEDPPPTAVLLGVGNIPTFDRGFDVTNASPLGRFFGLEITKTW